MHYKRPHVKDQGLKICPVFSPPVFHWLNSRKYILNYTTPFHFLQIQPFHKKSPLDRSSVVGVIHQMGSLMYISSRPKRLRLWSHQEGT